MNIMGNSEKRPRQEYVVLSHLRKYGSITSKEAMNEYGIMRLGARIYNLKKLGYIIDTVTEKSVNRYGEDVHYGKYILKKDIEEE